MKIHYIMHADFENIGVIGEWAQEKGHTITNTKPYKGESLPSVHNFNFLIILGGPQSPRDVVECPYLLDEIALIRQAIEHEKIVLGFCLGAQLISEALGGHTQRSPEKEIGIFPIRLTGAGQKDYLFSGFPEILDVIHWHNDMPEVPKGGTLLASSEGCPVQGFKYSDKVYGFQFHMEITKEGISELIAQCPNDIIPSRFTQSVAELKAANLGEIHEGMKVVLDRLIKERL